MADRTPDSTSLRADIFEMIEPAIFHHDDKFELERALDKVATYIEERELLARFDELSNTVIGSAGAIEHTVAFGRTISKTSRIAKLQHQSNKEKS